MYVDREANNEQTPLNLKCVASTGDTYCHTIIKAAGVRKNESNCFHEAQFSADGTTIITHNEDQHLRTFVLPSDLLNEEQRTHSLAPTCEFRSPSNIQSYAQYPGFDLRDTSTTVALCASANVPISLRNVLAYDVVHASYNLIKSTTEAYLPARSLIFSREGTQFIAGSDSMIAIFDSSRSGSGPISVRQLRHGRNARRLGYAIGVTECEGIVSTMSINTDRVLAVGTLSRQVGLFDSEGNGDCTATFTIAQEAPAFAGTGVAHVRWSPCGTYLLVAERQSDIVQVYDIRNTHGNVATLTGRQAYTSQKLGMDVIQTAESYEVWAGGTDGRVRRWTNPGKSEGALLPDGACNVSSSPVSSAIWHPTGAILATCCGTRLPLDDGGPDSASDSEDSSTAVSAARQPSRQAKPVLALDNSLKVWTF